MKKIKVNTSVIEDFGPCWDRFENWLNYYATFDGSIIEFLSLDKISAIDKIWVASRLLPRDLIVTFAIDCAFAAYAASAASAADAAAYTADNVTAFYSAVACSNSSGTAAVECVIYCENSPVAAYAAAAYAAAAYAADASYYASVRGNSIGYNDYDAKKAAKDERERQIDALVYLIETWED
jgi:hypothetical protein